jgi:hypothetical protein
MKKSLLFVALFTAASLLAQGPPPRGGRMGPGGPGGRGGPGGPGAGWMMDRPTVTGAPFSAVEVTETSQTLANGNLIQNRIPSNIYRDGMGRVRTEMTMTEPGSATTRTLIRISDPVAGVMRTLDPQNKTAHEMNMGPAGGRGQNGGGHPFPPPGRGQNGQAGLRGGAPRTAPNTATETLSMQTINGVQATGSRVTHTIPAGQIGNSQPIQTVREIWTASDLKVPVMVKQTDPRFGTTSTQLTNIVRSEPDPALFQVPSDYTVTKGGGPGRGPRGGGQIR